MGKELFVPWFAYLRKISLFLLSIVGLSWLSLILLFTSRKRQSREEYLGDKPQRCAKCLDAQNVWSPYLVTNWIIRIALGNDILEDSFEQLFNYV